jgi:hypothetical protein
MRTHIKLGLVEKTVKHNTIGLPNSDASVKRTLMVVRVNRNSDCKSEIRFADC